MKTVPHMSHRGNSQHYTQVCSYGILEWKHRHKRHADTDGSYSPLLFGEKKKN